MSRAIRWAAAWELVTVTLAFVAMLFALHLCTGCGPTAPSKDALEKAAGGTYASEHMWCVERFNSDVEIDACRAAVRRRWGIVDTARKDGGQ